MKVALLLSMLVWSFQVSATNYYVSASGNDNNSGTSTSSPWQTLNKLNSAFSSFKAGDNIYLNRGDVFYGSIIVTKSGSAGSPITIGAYGSGDKPVVTGFTTINSWSSLGSNIWESSSAVSTLPYTNMVAVNGVNTAMGRYPNSTGINTGYLTIKSHSGNSSIVGDGLGSTNWAGAGIVMRKQRWAWERGTVSSQSGNTLYYKDPAVDAPQDGFGFFIQNDPRTLDVNAEWYYNPSTKKLRIYSSSSPKNVQIATVEDLVSINRQSYLVFDNLSFEGANSNALSCLNYGRNLNIQNCSISFTGEEAIVSQMAYTTITGNSISYSNSLGVMTSEINSVITSNSFKNINMLEGMQKNVVSGAIISYGDNPIIQNNQIDTVGYLGIRFSGKNSIVKNNLVSNFCFIRDDGAGIAMASKNLAIGSVIDGNIILNAIGAGGGTSDPTASDASGIMIDAYGTGISILNNSVANCVNIGIKLHGANNITVTNNTCYNNGGKTWSTGGIELVSGPDYLIRNVSMQKNIFFARNKDQVAMFAYGAGAVLNDVLAFGTADNNYFAKPIDPSSAILSIRTYLSVPGWKVLSGRDANSNAAPKSINDVNDLRFEYNASSSSKTISLDANYVDVKNKSYDGSITLAPYSSAVLIRAGAKTGNIAPVADAGSDLSIQLPTNSVTLQGSGTDQDGKIASYLWTKKSGPAAGSLTNASSAQTGVNSLVNGVYEFQLTVTDDKGATGTSVVKVTVSAANSSTPPNVPPVVSAGADRTIQLPKNSLVLSGTASDADGRVTSYLWTKISGPSSGYVTDETVLQSGATGLVVGTYEFQLKVTDNQGATASSVLTVTVTSSSSTDVPNIPPVASVGSDRSIVLPKNSIVLPGKGNDVDGQIVSYEWSKISGPASGYITEPNVAQSGASGLVAGDYRFKLTVTDDNGATGSAILNVNVTSALTATIPNIPPVASVGSDRSIDLPKNSIVLPGQGSDADGQVVAYLWTKKSGPAGGYITDANVAQSGASGLTEGVYVFNLKVTDNKGATADANLTITVNNGALTRNSSSRLQAATMSSAPATNIPVVNAGHDTTIVLNSNNIMLNGSVTGNDVNNYRYDWNQVSGPSKTLFISNNSLKSDITNLVEGSYKFELTATDSKGNMGKDTITVNAISTASSPFALVNNLKGYPNPAVDVVTLEFNSGKPYSNVVITITDMNGKLAYKKKFVAALPNIVQKISLKQLDKGIYLVTAHIDGVGNQSVKIVKL